MASLEKIFTFITEAPIDLELNLLDKFIPKHNVIKSWSLKVERTTQWKIKVVFYYSVGCEELHWFVLKMRGITGSKA